MYSSTIFRVGGLKMYIYIVQCSVHCAVHELFPLLRSAADDEVKAMQLQREMRDKANRLQAMHAKYNTLEQVRVYKSFPLATVMYNVYTCINSLTILLEP